jgi:hypothetical protein
MQSRGAVLPPIHPTPHAGQFHQEEKRGIPVSRHLPHLSPGYLIYAGINLVLVYRGLWYIEPSSVIIPFFQDNQA